jgi:hypothetical protein
MGINQRFEATCLELQASSLRSPIGKVRDGGARSPAREARALPRRRVRESETLSPTPEVRALRGESSTGLALLAPRNAPTCHSRHALTPAFRPVPTQSTDG